MRKPGNEYIFSTIERKQVERRIKLLTKWFERLRKETLEQIKDDGVAVSDLCDEVSSLNALAIDKSIKTFVKDIMKLLSDSDTHELVFRYLNTYWSYLSYHLLEKLIRDYEMDDLEKKMEEFKAEVMEFMEETPVKVYAAAQITDVETPNGFVKFVSYHKYPKHSLLKCVEDIRRKFGTQYKFEEYALMLSTALPQSIEIVWFIPESVVQHVVQVTSTVETATFRKLMLMKIECNGKTIYEDDLTTNVKVKAGSPSRVRKNMYSLSPCRREKMCSIQVPQVLPLPKKMHLETSTKMIPKKHPRFVLHCAYMYSH